MTINTLKLNIKGMTCEHCAKTIEKKLDQLDGIVEKSISYREKNGTVKFEADKLSSDHIIDIINSIGHYQAETEVPDDELNSDFDLIIIGGGSAAFSAAIKASELDKTVLMINDGLPIGGTCVNVGCVPSKILIRAAEEYYKSKNPNFRSIKAGNSRLDFKELMNHKSSLVNDLQQKKYVDILSDDENVKIIKGFASFVDKNTISVKSELESFNGKTFTASNILIATGSTTFIPEIEGLNEVNYLTNETLYNLDELPKHLIILGGRYIALENAQLFARLGSKVTLLQRSKRILPNEIPDLTESLSGILADEGINIITGVSIQKIYQNNQEIKIDYLIDEEKHTLEGSHLFVATGRKGNTNGLGLDKVGVELHGNSFIKTDEYLRTTAYNIYAAGDVTGEYLFVYSAAYEGSLTVENMFNGAKRKKDYSVFPWVIFTDPQVAGIGMDENLAYKNNIDYDVSVISLKDIPRSIAANDTKGFIKLIRDKETDKIIGARILAHEGSELLMEIALAMKYSVTVNELKNMFHPYLTLSEGIKLAAIAFDKDVNKLSCCAV